MSIIAWLVLGALAGWLASIVTGRNDQMGCITNIAAGIVGAFVGGLIMSQLGGDGVTGFNLYSILVAFVGAVIVLFILNLVTGKD
ncbi:MAG: GlsB/YeaQ/YmgE family stress response membrane protein [Chloroflexia bacterium]|jgi:uncharacterized membrane protein YeaQ/YmgE (transglycosylase-associated protein family)|nr:GlsB/YeaQ/YmgE family stress response membrane protein [Chloroflexia bacterium]